MLNLDLEEILSALSVVLTVAALGFLVPAVFLDSTEEACVNFGKTIERPVKDTDFGCMYFEDNKWKSRRSFFRAAN